MFEELLGFPAATATTTELSLSETIEETGKFPNDTLATLEPPLRSPIPEIVTRVPACPIRGYICEIRQLFE